MEIPNRKTPGVYIDEINAFGNSVVPVATAIPAFIGYTPQASISGQSCINVAKKISSFKEFCEIYCLPNPSESGVVVKQYDPQYYLVAREEQPENEPYVYVGDHCYAILPDPNSIYYLYNSVRLFYSNGGGDAYIVSVGTYGKNTGKPISIGEQAINSNIKLNDLLGGLVLLQDQQEPTMYICPDATLLSEANNGTLMQEMLLQASKVKRAICIFDLIGARNANATNYLEGVRSFRERSGTIGLDYGTAYYPFVISTVMQKNDLDYTNIGRGDLNELKEILTSSEESNKEKEKIFEAINDPKNASLTTEQRNDLLIENSMLYRQIFDKVLEVANTLPPSGGMAGVIYNTDTTLGPWHPPANTSIASVVGLTMDINNAQQENLNIDATTGKSINALRSFVGKGILVWGARTLDGNSLDWRYLNVRRTATFIEQSCKESLAAYIYEPNSANTWLSVKNSIDNFLKGIWMQGALVGAKQSDAYTVECGLGTTMTSEDILNGVMNVSISVALVRPVEFIVITIQQQMSTSS